MSNGNKKETAEISRELAHKRNQFPFNVNNALTALVIAWTDAAMKANERNGGELPHLLDDEIIRWDPIDCDSLPKKRLLEVSIDDIEFDLHVQFDSDMADFYNFVRLAAQKYYQGKYPGNATGAEELGVELAYLKQEHDALSRKYHELKQGGKMRRAPALNKK